VPPPAHGRHRRPEGLLVVRVRLDLAKGARAYRRAPATAAVGLHQVPLPSKLGRQRRRPGRLGSHPPQPVSGDVPGRQRCRRAHVLSERAERQAVVDVIDHGYAAGPQEGPGRLELEAHVPPGVQAVVHEHVDLPELAQQAAEPLAACPGNIGPPGPQVLRDGHSDLGMQGGVDCGQIDAPQLTGAITLQPLQNDSAGESVSYTGLDNAYRPNVGDNAPYCRGKIAVRVVPPAIREHPHAHARGGEVADQRVPDLVECRRVRARPPPPQRSMQARCPIRDRSVEIARGNPERLLVALVLAPIRAPPQSLDPLPWVAQHGT
jgi:hypothetical protein